MKKVGFHQNLAWSLDVTGMVDYIYSNFTQTGAEYIPASSYSQTKELCFGGFNCCTDRY